MDNQIINGNGTAPNVTGFFSELPAVDDPGNATAYADYVSVFGDSVDGLNAYALGDLRSVVGAETFRNMLASYRTATSDVPALEFLRARVGGISVSSRIPAAASNVQTNILALTSYPGRNAVAPVWRGIELIRDPYTLAGKGQVRLTVLSFFNFKILRETGWKLWKTKLA